MEDNYAEVEDILRSILGQCFRDKFYRQGVEELRALLLDENTYSKKWENIARCIAGRQLEVGRALALIHNSANLPLDENTEDEAYKWLVLMVINASSGAGSKIFEY